MKLMPIAIITAAILWNSQLCAQSSTGEDKYIASGIRMHWLAPVTEDYKLGQGFGAQCWTEAEIKPSLSISAAIGYHRYEGYQHGYVHYDNYIKDNTPRQSIEILQINSLSFAIADVGLVYSFGNAWSIAWSSRVSHLHKAKTRNINLEVRQAPDPDFLRHTHFNQFLIYEYLLSEFDLGMQATVRYQIAHGIRIEMGLYQGFLNQWSAAFPGDESLRITSFNLGLSVRFF